ncbi:MAG TPA: hypothetical protein VNR87_09860 [Flavisolibacter sp.]|nr:hypothetical protein [Flavisolibacter sp.]
MKPVILIAGIVVAVYGTEIRPIRFLKPYRSCGKILCQLPLQDFPPSTIVDFTVRRLSKKTVLVSWHTEAEEDNRGFEIERKNGFQGVFLPVGMVSSKAGGSKRGPILDYSFLDTNSFSGTSYYRILQKDADGHGYYTVIKTANTGE